MFLAKSVITNFFILLNFMHYVLFTKYYVVESEKIVTLFHH